MNQLKLFLCIGIILFFSSCGKENTKPIITFEDAEKGAYPRLLSENNRAINLLDIENSVYKYAIEFVDVEQGKLVISYDLQYIFEDNNPDIGGNISKGPHPFKSFSSSDFTTNTNGFQGLEEISISAKELLTAACMSSEDLGPNDVFRITGSVTTKDGQTFAASNSSSSVKGAAFRGHFDYNRSVECPSELEGTYEVITTDSWCNSLDVPYNSSITFTLTPTGYEVSDFTFGAYAICYGESEVRPFGNLRILDICNIIEITGTSRWGDRYTWSNLVIDDKVMTFDWINDYGQGGSAQVIRPKGWPPLTLK